MDTIYRPMGMVSVTAGIAVFRQINRGTSTMTSRRTDHSMTSRVPVQYDVTIYCNGTCRKQRIGNLWGQGAADPPTKLLGEQVIHPAPGIFSASYS